METEALATKDDERKVLAKFKKAVDALGNDSYIGTAFAGIWELAEKNIDEDAGFSAMEWKCAADRVDERLEEQRVQYEKMLNAKEREIVEEHRLRYNAEAMMHNQEKEFTATARALEQQTETVKKQCIENKTIADKIDSLTNELTQRDEQILKLKAKIYDLLNL